MERHVILHNIRSAYNVGSIFRTADAAEVVKLYLTGYTPTPVDRFGRSRNDIAKVALGAEQHVPWEHHADIFGVLGKFQQKHVHVVAVEQAQRATQLGSFRPRAKTAYIFGNEIDGLSGDVLAAADTILEIPMQGRKESLNVSVAAGIVLFCTNTQ